MQTFTWLSREVQLLIVHVFKRLLVLEQLPMGVVLFKINIKEKAFSIKCYEPSQDDTVVEMHGPV